MSAVIPHNRNLHTIFFEIKITDNRLEKSTFKMKHLAAYLLLALAGNAEPSAADVKEVLSSVGIDADSERLEKLIAELQGKDLQEVSDTLRI